MLEKSVATIRQLYSGQAAKEDVAAVIRHHRIQASPGYRAAAQYVLDELQRAGLEASIERYPADYKTRFWSSSSFQEWVATAATLHLVEPAGEARKLADYREEKIALIQRSISFKGEAEVIRLDDGTEDHDYEGLDVSGKIVLTNGGAEPVRQLAVEKYGAIGIIFDGMSAAPPVREAMDLPDARQYTSFWWTGLPGEKQCFGFVLSPRQGAWLRRLISKRQAAGEGAIRVRASVESRNYDGAIEVVSALIPGETQESALVVSHLCHPQPSANDNASGVAANLEAARTLHRLIEAGDLPRPRRSIRFLWMPEMTGSYAYLSRHEDEIPHLVAGLNLDMVGEDQAQTGSVLLLEKPPDAAASFTPDLLERLREMVFDDVTTYSGAGRYSSHRYATAPFSGGSDHYIFSDPTVGVPMPMLIQWPDKFYHTTADTLDKVSPDSLARVGTVAAAYAYFTASAGEVETTWLAHEMTARFRAHLTRMVQDAVTKMWAAEDKKPAVLEGRVNYQLARHREALDTLARLWADAGQVTEELYGETARFAEQEVTRAGQLPFMKPGGSQEQGNSEEQGEWERKAAQMIPQRRFRGPGISIGALARLPVDERVAWRKLIASRSGGGYTETVLAEYWADGRRSALEIVDLVEMETGFRDAELIVSYFGLLKKLELVTIGTSHE